MTPHYRQILLKLSGEVLMGKKSYGFDYNEVERIAQDIKTCHDMGISICVVVGGGNIFRGATGAEGKLEPATADYMGMLSTVMNSLVLAGFLNKMGVTTRVLSAIEMSVVVERYTWRQAKHYLSLNNIVIFAGGTGNPFFTTDTAATLRAIEMGCDVLLKGTKTSGVFSADPFKNPDALFYRDITYDDVLTKGLRVMDATAVSLARDHAMPIQVFNIRTPGELPRVVCGEGIFSILSNKGESS